MAFTSSDRRTIIVSASVSHLRAPFLSMLAVRERVQKLRGSLVTRLRTLAIASSTFLHAHPSPSTPSTSASPPHAPISASPQAIRSTAHRVNFSNSSQSSTPRPPARRPFPARSPAALLRFWPVERELLLSIVPSGHALAALRPHHASAELLSACPASPARHGRTVSAGSAPYGTLISTTGVDPIARSSKRRW